MLRGDDHPKHIQGKHCPLTRTACELVDKNCRKKKLYKRELKEGRKKITEFLAVAILKSKLYTHVQQIVLGY